MAPQRPATPPTIQTLAELPAHVCRQRAAREAMVSIDRGGKRETWTTARWCESIEALARALDARGFRHGERIAILAENCPEWHVVDLAALRLGLVTVPIYPNLQPEQTAFLLSDSGSRALFARDHATLDEVARALSATAPARDVPQLLMVSLRPGDTAPGRLGLEDLLTEDRSGNDRGDDALTTDRFAGRVAPDDLATLIYTSGTTGEPKGVMLTHRNLVSNLVACAEIFPVHAGDVVLSFLPLSHVFQRTGDHLFLWAGARLHYVPQIERVPGALLDVKPNVLPSVPRLYERAYLRAISQIDKESPLKRRIFAWALDTARRVARQLENGGRLGLGLTIRRAFADRLVFRKLRERFGGRVRFAISGGAPLPREVGAFFNGAGFLLLEGYGLTETSPVVAANRIDRWKLGTVGRPLPGVEVRIADDGEILVRGDGVMRGYWNRPAETAEVLEADGWFHTGDIGAFDADGFLTITDRKKDMLVTSGGKNIAPQPIERALSGNSTIGQAVVFGDRYPYLVALLVPNFESLASELGMNDQGTIAADPRVLERAEVLVAKANRYLAEHERIRRFRLLDRELTVAGGELTPTLKIRRRVVAERFADLVAGMYLKSQKIEPQGRVPPLGLGPSIN